MTSPKEKQRETVKEATKHPAKEDASQPNKDAKEMQQEQQIQDLTSTLQHLQADFENYKKRVARDQEEYKQFAAKGFIIKLLPIVDAFELAIQDISKESSIKSSMNDSPAIKGIELIYAQLHSFLEKEGVQPMTSLHQPYNLHVHEAIMTEKTTDPNKKNMVTEEFQKGYLMHGRILRPAKVKIAIE